MSDNALQEIFSYAQAGIELRQKFFEQQGETLVEIGRVMAISLAKGGKILLCGNGGSAADSQHIAAEFVNRFELERPPLPAIALTTDTSAITAIGNDFGFDQIFEKQIKALGCAGDVLVGISTSGKSANINKALKLASNIDMITVGLGGRKNALMAEHCAHFIEVDDDCTPLVQELHIAAGHVLCKMVDYFLFEAVTEIQPFLS